MFEYRDIVSKLHEGFMDAVGHDLTDEGMKDALTILRSNYPFYNSILKSIKFKKFNAPENCGGMATDGATIYYDISKMKSLGFTTTNIVAIIIHEVMHIIFLHNFRLKDRDPELFNYAADYAINLLIDEVQSYNTAGGTVMLSSEFKLKMPKGTLLDPQFKDMSAEEIYDILLKIIKNNQKDYPNWNKKLNKNGKGSPNDKGSPSDKGSPNDKGSACDKGTACDKGSPSDKGSPRGFDDHIIKDYGPGRDILQPSDETSPREIEQNIRESSKKWGGGSANVERMLKETHKNKVNWRSILKKFINDEGAKIKVKIPNRRFVHQKQYIDGTYTEYNVIKDPVLIIDTSGSVGGVSLGAFLSELKHIYRNTQFKDMHLLMHDEDVKQVYYFKDNNEFVSKIDKIKFVGGGGTNFKPGFDWVNKNLIKKGKNPGYVIFFTDLYGQFPSIESVARYKQKVIWFIVNNSEPKPPFGKVVYFSDSDI